VDDMYVKLDYNGKIKRPKLFLRIPDKEGVGELKIGEKLSFELNANDISLISFNVYRNLDGKDINYYDLVTEGSLIEAQLLGVYWIIDIEEHGTGANAYKEVKGKSLEYELKRRKIFDISGVFSFYSVADTSTSLMHIISSSLGNWSIGHIDNSLKTLYRTFDIDSSDVYSLLTDNISTSFKCIFQFDYYNRVINAYMIENFGKNTNIFLSYRNLIQENIITSSLENVVTCFRVRGGNDLDIRAVNPTLDNKIYNYDYFMIAKSDGGKASDGLVSAWNSYKTLYNSLSETQQNNLSLLKTYNNELLNLKTEVPSSPTTDWTQYGLDELEAKKSVYTNLQSVMLSNGAGSTSSLQHAEYTSTRNTLLAIQAEIVVRSNQISAKEAQITSLNTSMNNISNQLSLSSNFTVDQIKEMRNFTFEDDYVDETYVVSDSDTKEEILNVKQQLYDVSSEELARVSIPQYTIDTTLNNLFALPEFSVYQEDFELGNIVKIRFDKNRVATARLLSIKIDFEKIDDLSVVFSNRNKLDNNTIDFAKIQSQASQTSNSVSVGGIGWDKAASQTNIVQEYMNGSLNTANQEIVNGDGHEVTYGGYGLRLREKNELTGQYSPEETWITKNKLLFSNDNFASAIAGIGKFTNPTTGQTYYGFIGEAIISNIVISEALGIYNQNNSIVLNKDGATFTNCDITINKGVNTLILNAVDGIKLTKNGVSQFYIDGSGEAMFGGSLNAASGTFKGSLQAATGTFSGNLSAAGGTFSGNLSAAGGTFTGTLQGVDGTFSGTISASNITGTTITGGTISGTNISGVTISAGGEAYFASLFVTGTSSLISIGGGQIDGVNFLETKYLNGQSISGKTLITNSNISGYIPSTSSIDADVMESAYIQFSGGRAAGYSWCLSTFELKASSDKRLKKNIKDLSELPIELYLSLVPKQFEFIDDPYNKGIFFGFLAQDVIEEFNIFGYNALDYNLVEKVDIRTDNPDESIYIKDGYKYRINYTNFNAWTVLITQKMWNKINNV
jgi:hypothetical protein